jgi:hypothetical protein
MLTNHSNWRTDFKETEKTNLLRYQKYSLESMAQVISQR